jgi:hypothetical protein
MHKLYHRTDQALVFFDNIYPTETVSLRILCGSMVVLMFVYSYPLFSPQSSWRSDLAINFSPIAEHMVRN